MQQRGAPKAAPSQTVVCSQSDRLVNSTSPTGAGGILAWPVSTAALHRDPKLYFPSAPKRQLLPKTKTLGAESRSTHSPQPSKARAGGRAAQDRDFMAFIRNLFKSMHICESTVFPTVFSAATCQYRLGSEHTTCASVHAYCHVCHSATQCQQTLTDTQAQILGLWSIMNCRAFSTQGVL